MRSTSASTGLSVCGSKISPAGQPVVIAELARREAFNWTTEEFCDRILKMDGLLGLFEGAARHVLRPGRSGCAEARPASLRSRSCARKAFIQIADKSSIRDGCVRIMDALADPDLPLLVSKSCKWLIEVSGPVGARQENHPDVYGEKSDLRSRAGCAALLLRQPAGGPPLRVAADELRRARRRGCRHLLVVGRAPVPPLPTRRCA